MRSQQARNVDHDLRHLWVNRTVTSTIRTCIVTYHLLILNHHYSTTIAQQGMCIHFPSTLLNKMSRWSNYWRNKLPLCFNFNQLFAPASELQEKLYCIISVFFLSKTFDCMQRLNFLCFSATVFSVQRFHKSPSSITFRTRMCRLYVLSGHPLCALTWRTLDFLASGIYLGDTHSARKRSCGKVMFLQVSVCPSWGDR